jgi:hypothetical protein
MTKYLCRIGNYSGEGERKVDRLAVAKTEGMLLCHLVQTYKAGTCPEDGRPSLKEGPPSTLRKAAPSLEDGHPDSEDGRPDPEDGRTGLRPSLHLTDRPAPGVLPPLPYPAMPPSSVVRQLPTWSTPHFLHSRGYFRFDKLSTYLLLNHNL